MRTQRMMVWAYLALTAACRGEVAEHQDHPDHEQDSHDGQPAQPGRVTLSPQAEAAARLKIGPATAGRLAHPISTSARISLDPTRHALVGAWVQGQVDAIRVRVGDHLQAGALLATVHTPDLGGAVGEYRSAQVRVFSARERLARLTATQEGGVSSEAQLRDAQTAVGEAESALEGAEERLRVMGVNPGQGEPTRGEHYPAHVPVKSPIAGEVLQVLATVGQHVEAGAPLVRVGDLDQVWLLADLFEGDLARVRPGQPIEFTVQAWPGERFKGAVDQVGSWVEPDGRTVEVRAVVDNKDHRLKPNMFAQATITGPAEVGAEGVLLPQEAVTLIEGVPSVFTQEGAGVFAARPVEVLGRAAGEALVGGIPLGTPVVLEGAFTLKSELEKGALGGGHAH